MCDVQSKQSWRDKGRLTVFALLISMTCATAAQAVTHLKRGAEAPAITLKDAAGRDFTQANLRDKVAVLIFGELYHDKTLEACAAVNAVVGDARLVGQPIVTVLVTAREIGAAADDGAARAGNDRLPAVIARDPDRKAYAAYQVAVMPSVVVIDPRGRVVYAVAGMVPRFADVLTDSLLFACGKLTGENLDRSLVLAPTTQASDFELRSQRTCLLARQLMRRGLDEMAAEKYREALEMDPRSAEAHLDLGMLLMKHQRLAEAEAQFRAVLKDQPNSMQASLGLAFVQVLRGGKEAGVRFGLRFPAGRGMHGGDDFAVVVDDPERL
jgi:tetratricopeptide (TPR) repeat protein